MLSPPITVMSRLGSVLLGGVVFGCAPSPDAAPTSPEPAPSQGSVAQPSPAGAIEDAFAAYVQALRAGDGNTAADLVTPESIAHYDTTLTAAKEMEAAELRARPVAEQLAVLTVRARFSPEELAPMNGRTLFVTSVERGWVGRHVAQSKLRVVEVTPPTATIQLEKENGSVGDPIPAYRQVDGRWLFDLPQMLPHADRAIEAGLGRMTADGKLTTDAALMQMLSKIVGRELDEGIWEPIGHTG